MQPSKGRLSAIIKLFDKDVDGRISYSEFREILYIIRPTDMARLYDHSSEMFQFSSAAMLADMRVALGTRPGASNESSSSTAAREYVRKSAEQLGISDDLLRLVVGSLSALVAQVVALLFPLSSVWNPSPPQSASSARTMRSGSNHAEER